MRNYLLFTFIACNHYTHPTVHPHSVDCTRIIYDTGGIYCYKPQETFLIHYHITSVSQESFLSAPNVPCQNIQ